MSARRRAAWPALAAAVLALGAGACGGGDAPEASGGAPSAAATATAPPATTAAPATTAPRPEPPAAPLPGLPPYTAGFQDWERLNARPIPPDSAQTRRVGFDAHRSVKDVYVNQPRARLTAPGGGQRLPYPDGTILVKAGREGDRIALVAVMRRIQGVDPAHGDWEFVEYKSDAAGEPFATGAGLTGATCWGCHGIAEDSDWVFTPLDP